MVNLQTYLDIVLPAKYKETIEREAKIEDKNATFMNVIFSVILSLATNAVYYMTRADPATFAANSSIVIDKSSFFYKLMVYNPYSSVFSILLLIISQFVFFYVFIALLNFVARALGGNGRLNNLLYLYSVLVVPVSIVTGVNQVITSLAPLLSCVTGILALVFSLYCLYLQYKALRSVHTALSMWMAIASYVIYAVSISIVSVLVVFAQIMI